MGTMRFRVYDRDRIGDEALGRLFIAGGEDIPWSTRARWDGDLLVVQRQVNDSGYVYIPWSVEGRGTLLLSTGTLMERQKPYVLEVELARGMLHRLRTRLFVWEWLGLRTPDSCRARLQEAIRLFASAATQQDDLAEASRQANAAIAVGVEVSEAIASHYSQQSLLARRAQSLPTTLMGVALGAESPSVAIRRRLLDFCNLVQLPLAWRTIEAREGRRDWKPTDEQLGWCQAAGLKVAAGPLLRMDDRGAPDWMYLWEGDYDNLARQMLDHVRAVVTRYAGRVHLWHVASRLNNGTLLSLNEEQRLNIVAQALHIVRTVDPRTPTVVSFDQPWGEYLAQRDEELAPLHYADALVRADLGVSGFGLEINSGCYPRGSARRPVYDYGRLIDQWSQLGLPLMLLLSAPSRTDDDPLAAPGVRVEPTGDPALVQPGPGSDVQRFIDPQEAWASLVLPLALARTTV
ncbi:MAG: endo-1,4-beta-xylanase, partial [Planctomycetales bacterium]|nr:endo-1,4-beta-xylanase [Planctomycetales bacterium]